MIVRHQYSVLLALVFLWTSLGTPDVPARGLFERSGDDPAPEDAVQVPSWAQAIMDEERASLYPAAGGYVGTGVGG